HGLGCEPEIAIAIARLRVVQSGELGPSWRGGKEERHQSGVTAFNWAVAQGCKNASHQRGFESLGLRLRCGISLTDAFHGRADLTGARIERVPGGSVGCSNRRERQAYRGHLGAT